jgi:cysteinyl-tRNA synthetase
MLTVNSQKMSKSLGNSFLPEELITGNHELLDQPYSPMTVRFFMLQSHYSSTLDFSNDALKAAMKGYFKLINGVKIAKSLKYDDEETISINDKQVNEIDRICEQCYSAMNDDFNTATTISHLFNILKKINNLHNGNLKAAELGEKTFDKLVDTFIIFVQDILGLKVENPDNHDQLLDILLEFYKEAKSKKDYDKVDLIRARLKKMGIVLKDMRHQIDWAYEE